MTQIGLDPTSTTCSPLEAFLRDYSEVAGGAWEEVEPQVYDLLLPAERFESARGRPDESIVRVAFDPEALPEHDGAQLAAFGTPLVDRLLSAAVERGRWSQAYFNGLNLLPYDLAKQVRHAMTLPAGVELQIQRTRRMHFAQALFWFEVAFVSDQKEHEILPIGFDLHTGREVRRLEQLLDFSRLSEQAAEELVETRRVSLPQAFSSARARVLRTISALANSRRRELEERLERQVRRMEGYYRDLRAELLEGIERAEKRHESIEKFSQRLEAIDRERRLRIAEQRQKSALSVRLRLISLLLVHQPKVVIKCRACASQTGMLAPLDLIWDPLSESVEAPACPLCGAPTYVLELAARSSLACPGCRASAAAPPTIRRKG